MSFSFSQLTKRENESLPPDGIKYITTHTLKCLKMKHLFVVRHKQKKKLLKFHTFSIHVSAQILLIM